MRVLILGAKGNLGLAFLDLYKYSEITAWDREQLDITNQADVEKKITELAPNLVINCAAYTAVDRAEEEKSIASSVNGLAPGYIAKVCKKIGATLVHYSTGQVFDGSNREGYNEDALPAPVNEYGISKLLGEQEIQKNTDQFYIIRSAWLFGKSPVGKKSFIDIMLDLAGKNQGIRAINDEFGTPTYVKDLAEASWAIIEHKRPFGIYHLVNSGRATRYDWAQEIFRIKNIDAKLVSVPASEFPPRAAKRPKFEILNNTKFIQLRPWQEALEEFLSSN